ncbi:hypothetical protein ACHAW5_003130 [Stephanodiscus triporus]|uniref:Hexosyltransferase n=1 Tax=Stephanodiscus triporus TaxID=2934178 RepID=A0ABD3N3N6_9STRA
MTQPSRQVAGKIGGGGVGGGRGSHHRSKLKVTPEAILLVTFIVWLLVCVQFYLFGELQPPKQGKGHEKDTIDVARARNDDARISDTRNNDRSVGESGGSSSAESRSNGSSNNDIYFPEHYMTFSTACSSSQNWESFMLFYYAHKVGQPGKVVRIASGCSQKEQDDLTKFHLEIISKLSPNFSVHFTPDFAKVSGDNYKYYNKPFGLRHWMEHGLKFETNKDKYEDAIVVVLDPDMILLRPLTYDFTNSNVMIHASKRGPPKVRMVTHGQPWASLYGFNNGPFRSVDLKHVFANHTDSPALLVPKDEQVNNYAGGPPYMATGRDMFAIVNVWCELVPSVHHEYRALLGEMYGWSLAAAHLGLPHTLSESFMISATGMGSGEGWPLIDQLKDDEVCEFPTLKEKEEKLPYVIHYCQSYWLGKWFIGKYRLDKEFLSCEKPLLLEPPKDIGSKYDYYIKPGGKPYGEKKSIGPTTAKREQFMICQIIARLNDAATWYKDQACEKGTANYEKSWIFHHSLDPDNNDGGEKKTKNEW